MADKIKLTGIYVIKNILNGKYYVGSAFNIKARWRVHLCQLLKNKHHSIHLQRAWNKYGADSFIFEAIQYCSKEDLTLNEQFWIDHFISFNKGYNCKYKAENGSSNINKKRGPMSESHKQAIRDSKKNISPETRLKLSIANTGYKHSIERRKKQSERQKGNIPTNCIPILQFDLNNNFIKEWTSAHKAAQELNLSQSNIWSVLNNKRKSTGNFKFKNK